MEQHCSVQGCADCIAFLGCCETPEDRPNLAANIEARWPHEEWDLHVGQGDEPFFSWQPCECCGSDLGGGRELVIAITQKSWQLYPV